MIYHTAIDQAIEYIRLNWKQGKNLQEVASMYGVDPGNLDRAFRNAEGVTEKHFVDRMRKEYVLARIKLDSIFGYEIGCALGFPDDLAFYRWVKRAFGVSFHDMRARRSQIELRFVNKKT